MIKIEGTMINVLRIVKRGCQGLIILYRTYFGPYPMNKLKSYFSYLIVISIISFTTVSGINVVDDDEFINSYPTSLDTYWPVHTWDPHGSHGGGDSVLDLSGDKVYHADIKNALRIRGQSFSSELISKFDHSGSLSFDYEILKNDAEAFGIYIESAPYGATQITYEIFLFVGLSNAGGDYVKLSNDNDPGGWKSISINFYDKWVNHGHPDDARVDYVGIFVDDFGSEYTEVYLDSIVLDKETAGGGGGGPPPEFEP